MAAHGDMRGGHSAASTIANNIAFAPILSNYRDLLARANLGHLGAAFRAELQVLRASTTGLPPLWLKGQYNAASTLTVCAGDASWPRLIENASSLSA